MSEFNQVRQAYVLDNWCRVLKRLPTGDTQQPVPESYEQALAYFQMSSVQVKSN